MGEVGELANIPEFWQGVLASLVAAVIFAITVALLRFVSTGANDWFTRRKAQREMLKQALVKGNDLLKTHAAMRLIFHTLKWLFIGNMLWILPEAAEATFPYIFSRSIFIFKFGSLVCFFLGMRWISFYASLSKL